MSNGGDVSLTQIIARLRRAQPRNADTMAVCDALEARSSTVSVIVDSSLSAPAKFDRAAYMRDYMRARRRKAVD